MAAIDPLEVDAIITRLLARLIPRAAVLLLDTV